MKRFLISFVIATFFAHATPAFAASALQTQINAGSIPRGAQRVEMLQLKLTANCEEPIVISSLRVHHRGLGDSADIVRVYAMESGKRISRSTSFHSSDQTAIIRMRAFSVPTCTTKTLSIHVDFSADAVSGAQHSLSLLSGADIETDSDRIELRSEVAGPIVTTTPGTIGTVDVEYLPVHGPVRYGSNRTVARIKVTAREKNQEIHMITLTNDGSARDADLQNLYLETSAGEQISGRLSALDGSVASFILDPPLHLDRSDSKVLELKADIRASRGRTIDFEIEEPSDIQSTVRRSR